MPIPRARAPEELYDEVAGYDLVLTPDGPLSSAINGQLDSPHLGPFATPPRRLAAGRRETAEDRLAFLEMVDHDDVSWKRAAYSIGNILQCWEHQETHDAILDYDAYADAATGRAVERIADLDTTSMELTEGRINPERDVAVVAPEMLTPLERSFLPESYDAVELFTDDAFEPPQFHVFDSATAIVDAVVDAITVDTAGEVGIVLDSASEYSPLVESALEAADVPFFGGPGFADVAEHRSYLQLLRTAHRGTETRIGEVRPLLAALGIDLDVAHDEKRLYECSRAALDWLTTFCRDVGEYSFAEALSAFERRANCDLPAFHEELETLGLAAEPVTERGVDRLRFYLQSYEVPVERENSGVLLADAKSASFVGRDVVFFLGLDEGWTHSAPQRPWIDRDGQYTRNLQGFQLLLQSGTDQHYLVQDATGGSPVTPCLHFEELLDREYERFSDLPSIEHHSGHDDDATTTAFETSPVDAGIDSVETLSQSSLNTYVNSPREYYFSRLLDSPETDYLAEGTLFHDFAEFVVAHPAFVDDGVIDEVVDLMIREIRPLVRAVDEATRRTRYRVGLETIASYLDANPPSNDAFLTPSSGRGENVVAAHFDRPIDSPVTERWFEDGDLGLKGKIDLVHAPTDLLDYKSGRKKSAREVVKHSAIESPTDEPNFQALLYLAYWRSRRSDEELTFTFFHFLEVVDDVVAGEATLDDALTTVSYYPTSLSDHVRTEAFFEYLCEAGANDCRKTLSQVEYATYADCFENDRPPATADSDEIIDSAFGEGMVARLQDAVGEYKYVTSGSEQIMREFARVYGRNYFAADVDAFESFVDERLAELDRRHRGEERFPVSGLAGEPNYRRIEHRDLLLEGER